MRMYIISSPHTSLWDLHIIRRFFIRGATTCFLSANGGNVVLSYSLGLLPILGAYPIQFGDLTLRIYIAALPVVVVTALWVWVEESEISEHV